MAVTQDRVGFEIGVEPRRARIAPQTEPPYRIALLGDFSGRANRNLVETGSRLAARRPFLVDRDNLDEVLGRLQPELHLPVREGGAGLRVIFRQIEDFHPDRLFHRLAVFEPLRELRKRLQDPATFADAARQLETAQRRTPSAPEAPVAVPSNLLEQMLEGFEGQTTQRPSRRPDDLQEFLNRVVAPHLKPSPDPRQPEIIARVDAIITGLMRAILHHPDFQALESVWRALDWLVRRLETGTDLKVYLFDVTAAELAADLSAGGELRRTALYKLLVESSVETPGAEPWSILAGNYTFGPSRQALELLARLAGIARAAGAPWIAAAGSGLAGCSSLAQTPDPEHWDSTPNSAWELLRGIPEAPYVGLALPRFLLRLPYGAQADDSVESFRFEEMDPVPAHDAYLWGNPAVACVCLMAEGTLDLDRLPLHLYRENGETTAKPCGEVLLTERAAERLLELGLMPLVTLKGTDRVRVLQFQSIARPPCALAGRWERA